MGDTYPIGKHNTFELEPGQTFTIEGKLYEWDPFDPDNMGTNQLPIHYDNFGPNQKTYYLPFQESSQIVEAVYKV